ncbi:MAG: hypothetical protein HY929_07045 [Euryarchaeota archaeon]|nr:hypothetical protein [Euryarchaeota archaeon]
MEAKTKVVTEKGIAYFYPCISEGGKIMAEAIVRLPEYKFDTRYKYRFFDPSVLCTFLEDNPLFDSVRCSQRLGMAKIDYDEKTIILFQNGKINVRRARDKEDAQETIRLVSKVIWPATICTYCRNSGADCASGSCEDCMTKVCPILLEGPPDPLSAPTKSAEQITGYMIFQKIRNLPTRPIFEEGFNKLNGIFSKFIETYKNMFDGKIAQDLQVELKEANKNAINFIINTERKEDATFGLILLGLSLDISRMLDGFNSLIVLVKDKKMPEQLSRVHKLSLEIISDAFDAFKNADKELAKIAINKYQELINEFKKFEKECPEIILEVKKIATNGFYIARLLTKPLPA